MQNVLFLPVTLNNPINKVLYTVLGRTHKTEILRQVMNIKMTVA